MTREVSGQLLKRRLRGAVALSLWATLHPLHECQLVVLSLPSSSFRCRPRLDFEAMASIVYLFAVFSRVAAVPSDCLLCSTCGGSYPYQIAFLRSESYMEYQSDCGAPLLTQTDTARVCCSTQPTPSPATEKKSRVAATNVTAASIPRSVETAAAASTPKEEEIPYFVPQECIVCYSCGSGFTSNLATLLKANWLEYASGCTGEAKTQSDDNAEICCLPPTQNQELHV